MKNWREHMIRTWGVLDIMTILWYMGWSVSKNQMPFVYDIKHQFLDAAPQIGMATAVSLSLVVFAAFMSLIASGILLIRRRKAGVVIAFIQTPVRLLTVIPPSIFFLLWPLGSLLDSPSAAIGFSLTLLVELVKLSSMIAWWLRTARDTSSMKP